ncbi:Phosphoribosyltransferase [uncultured Paludibacter sp.]|uniref:Phosphoribosyltransferase n=1 Tax=uncultured Paludibacter sp. TaxID=497635 RepID=A0A653AFP6_9BACT|nr:Phosphoribosyltransferase [uncultured Paludibacter sp.]
MSFHSSFMDLLFPNLCVTCGESLVKGESFICLKCLNEVPKTNFHLQKENEVEKRFWGKVPVEKATSYFFFEKGSKFQHLLHELKYKGNKEIGEILGKYAAAELLQNEAYNSVDLIVPVPLHPKKEAKRGYNQSEWICKGISAVFNKPLIVNNLIRSKETETQTKKSVYERFENMQDIFEVKNPAEFNGKHILLVDDVLTTGSTLEACIQALQKSKNVKVSVFTLAIA